MQKVAFILNGQCKYEECLELVERAIVLRQTVLSEDHPETLFSMEILIQCLIDRDKFAEAEDLCRQVLELRKNKYRPTHKDTLNRTVQLAQILSGLGKYDEAEKLYPFNRTMRK